MDVICVSPLIVVSIVVKEELANATVNYDTVTEDMYEIQPEV